MKKILCLLGISLLCILLAGCTQHTTPAARAYTNDFYGFSFDPPVGWQQIQNNDNDVAVRFSPQNTTNVSLIIAVPFTLSEGRALSTFADQTEENLLASGANYSVVHRDWLTIADLQAYELAYTYVQNDGTEYVKQVAVLKTRTVYLITFTAPEPLAEQYLMVVDQSIRSFL